MESKPLIILSAFETGLGVIRSLGELGYHSYCLDFKKDIAFFSRYSKNILVSHPLEDTETFLEEIIKFGRQFSVKPIVFFTSDDFLRVFINHRELLSKYFRFNILSDYCYDVINDKYNLYSFCKLHGINVPQTYMIQNETDLLSLDYSELKYPMIIKGADVNSWRSKIHGSLKGFKVSNTHELKEKASLIISKGVSFLIQEIIPGPDSNHYKYCAYYSANGERYAYFTLRKIRQYPIHFGVGASVQSINEPSLIEIGEKLFKSLGATGVVSAEFKKDSSSNVFKLIEINARYWQQNYLATVCGVNFPLIQIKDIENQINLEQVDFKDGMKWVNRYMDFNAFMDYRREGGFTFSQWRKSLQGVKTYPDFTWRDPLPLLYELDYGKKILNIPKYIWFRLLKKRAKCEIN